VARRPLEREGVCLDGGRRTTQLMRDSLGGTRTPLMRYLIPPLMAALLHACAAGPHSLQQAWFSETRTIDLDGDGRPDTVKIIAVGPSSDRLHVTLSLLVSGKESWQEQWNSDYMLIDPPQFPNGEHDRAVFVRTRSPVLSGASRWAHSIRLSTF